MKQIGKGNNIDPTAKIDENVILGNYNNIGKNVIISGFKGKGEKIYIGDCNLIHDNTRILIGEKGAIIGDWNVFHNSMLVMGNKRLEIGHNCWFGQNTIVDSSGGLKIGNGVRVGMYSQIWTHVASGEIIEGCTLFGEKETIIEDEVWLVGSCTVASGLRLGYRSTCLINSNITKSTDSLQVYGGNPAKLLQKLSFWKDVTLKEKLSMMHDWVKDYCLMQKTINYSYNIENSRIELKDTISGEQLIIGLEYPNRITGIKTTFFNLKTKKYTKKLTHLEMDFYKFIFGNKARFIPED